MAVVRLHVYGVGGLHEEHIVATWHLGDRLICVAYWNDAVCSEDHATSRTSQRTHCLNYKNISAFEPPSPPLLAQDPATIVAMTTTIL